MSDAKAAWDEVGNRFANLAGHVKEQFDARTAEGGPGSEQVDDAVRTLVRAVDHAFTAIGDTLRDPSLRDDLKHAASAMGDAIATTFRDVSDRISTHTPSGSSGPSNGEGGAASGDGANVG
jgi:enamine deaminase RidA (YjgF/YER057c/UK114 family)